jgi:hypothetical protein
MTFSTLPADITVDRGGDVSFNCTYPLVNANITWNGPGVEAGSIKQSVNMGASTSILTIMNVNGLHAGEYFCTAHIGEEMVINSTAAYLTVTNCKCRAKKEKSIVV